VQAGSARHGLCDKDRRSWPERAGRGQRHTRRDVALELSPEALLPVGSSRLPPFTGGRHGEHHHEDQDQHEGAEPVPCPSRYRARVVGMGDFGQTDEGEAAAQCNDAISG
jgi:hypothetical protein